MAGYLLSYGCVILKAGVKIIKIAKQDFIDKSFPKINNQVVEM